jgi:hypothetical protein
VVHHKIKIAISGAETEHSMYARAGNSAEENDWSQAQAAKYEAVLILLRAALALGELLFGKDAEHKSSPKIVDPPQKLRCSVCGKLTFATDAGYMVQHSQHTPFDACPGSNKPGVNPEETV